MVVPVMMVVILVVIQFVLWAHAAQVVQLAASEGDRAARTAGGGAIAGQARAQSVLAASGASVTSATASVSILPAELAQVTVTGRAETVLPWLRLPVSATEVGPIQQFRTSG